MAHRGRMSLLLMMGKGLFTYRRYWLHTIHVAPTGNDTTGNGSLVAPYLTIKKALTVAVSGDGILCADGTYIENDGGALKIQKVNTNWVVIEPEKGAAGAVTISTTSGTNPTYIGVSSAYYSFRYITFTTCAGATGAFYFGSQADHIGFINCTLNPVAGASKTFSAYAGSTWGFTNISFTNCTFNKPPGAATHDCFTVQMGGSGVSSAWKLSNCVIDSIRRGVELTNADGFTFQNCMVTGGTEESFKLNSSPDGLSLINCTATATLACVLADGATNLSIIGGSYYSTSWESTLSFGKDGESGGNATTALVMYATVNHLNGGFGHTILLGNGCTNCVLDNVTSTTSHQSCVVIKEHTGSEIKNCHLTSGTSNALYFKAAVSANAHDNVIIAAQGRGFSVGVGGTGNKNQNWLFQHNVITVSGTGRALDIGGAADDAGGGICDYNTYTKNTDLGRCRADYTAADIAGLIAAWADYDVVTNDAHSVMV